MKMRTSNLLPLLVAMVVTAALFLTGCVAKPKLDLSNLQDYPNANGDGGLDGLDGLNGDGALNGLEDGGFVPGGDFGPGGIVDPFGADGSQDGLNGLNGLDGENGANGGNLDRGGAWGGTDSPVAGGEDDGTGFIKNGQRWTDCVIYFAYDQYEVGAAERAKLDTLAKYLAENPKLGVIVEGHTDERGSDEYNRALGERRALAVTQYLGLLGVDATRCKTISYGEDKPAKSPAVTEADHQLNRRAEFLIGDL